MKRLYLIYICILFPLCLMAQKESQAKEILQKTEQTLAKAGGIIAEFEGNINGSIHLKGQKFHLKANGIESWYDGETLWSYMDDTEEVNVSLPTEDELQSINPYLWIQAYKAGYHYKMGNNRTKNGKKGYEITLMPEEKQSISSIKLFITEQYIPIYIEVAQGNDHTYTIHVTGYKANQPIADSHFVFDKAKYPDAEVIDLR